MIQWFMKVVKKKQCCNKIYFKKCSCKSKNKKNYNCNICNKKIKKLIKLLNLIFQYI